jgi:tetratricopeptide (TPR) repeat protein
MSLGGLALAADDAPVTPVQKQVDSALHSVLLIAGVLVVLILVAVAIIVYRKAFSTAAGEPPAPAPPSDPLADAAAEERRGNWGAAAERYEAGGDKLKAAECWEKVKDLTRAAECWEAGGDLERAAQLHVRSGSALRAAGIYMKTNNYIEAAKIFRNKGDHLRAAQALELYGNKLAAAREYTAAGNHAYAARLLEQERMYAEAAEAYRPLLEGDAITAANADRFSTYAALLGLAGERDRAAALYRRVLDALPGNPRALSGLRELEPRAPGETAPVTAAAPQPAPASVPGADAQAGTGDLELEILEPAEPPPPSPEELARLSEHFAADNGGDPLHHVFTLRSMIHAGRMEPRYSMRLWVQVMRALAERHGANVVLGCLSPDSIVIDMENNVRIDKAAACSPAYRSPEVLAGLTPDRQADIYSMGVILYELVSGSLAQFGARRAGEQFSDVPPWLDELIERCTDKDLARRYRTAEEVSAALLKLKSAPQG